MNGLGNFQVADPVAEGAPRVVPIGELAQEVEPQSLDLHRLTFARRDGAGGRLEHLRGSADTALINDLLYRHQRQ